MRIVITKLKQRPIKRKTILGPIFRLNEKFLFLMSIVVPNPQSWRVEPHIVYNPEESISYKKEGSLIEITGNVILAKYEGLEKLLYQGFKDNIFPSYHIAHWGVPVLVPPIEFRFPDEQLTAALYALGVWKVSEWTNKKLINKLEIKVT